MPRLLAALAALLILIGCDSSSEIGAPTWARAGAILRYDYVPGPDSLRYGPVYPRRALLATFGIVEMRAGGPGAYGSVPINWFTTDTGKPRYDDYYVLPLNGEYVFATERGVEVALPSGCSGGILGSSRGSTSYVRVPRVAGDVQTYVPCSLSPSEVYRIVGTERVVTPAGTFETYVFESGSTVDGQGGAAREYWNYDAGLVQFDLLNEAGVLRGRLMLASTGVGT